MGERTAALLQALRDDFAIVGPLPVALVKVSGPDAQDYLNRRLTANMRTLKPGECRQACLLGGDGRLVGFGIAASLPGDPAAFGLVLDPECGRAVAESLEKYIFMEKCEAVLVDGPLSQILVCGPGAPAAMERWDESLPASSEAVAATPATRGAMLAVRIAHEGTPLYRVICRDGDAGGVYESLVQLAADRPAAAFGPEFHDHVRVALGIPLFGSDAGPTTIPIEARLEPAIDYDKGCFPGQEIVARIRNLGHPANVMVKVAVASDRAPEHGTPLLLDGKTIGRITTAVYPGPGGTASGLATVKWACREAGQELAADMGASETAVVTVTG